MPFLPATAALLASLQIASADARPPRNAPPATPTVVAVQALRPPVLDGRDDDDVWRTAPAVTEFREFQPVEDKDPRYATEARVAYDARNIYVFVRAFDPAPDSIRSFLARRDMWTPSDHIKIIIDSYHDRRTGYEFAVNPAGVKRDYAIYDDQQEDEAWDGVWEVVTQIDSLGWTAEYRVPLSQLRYAPSDQTTFGFGVWRDIQRHSERVSWPVYRVTKAGLASQLGELTGLTGLATPRRLEIMPYGVAKSAAVPQGAAFEQSQQLAGGADVKYGLTSNLTLDATVNPDFGQVEADPAVLNLGAFETFFQERRPFFLEGTGSFQFPVNCSIVNCSGEVLFYSRRIGRSPQLTGRYGNERSPTATTIWGAAKLTGQLPGGFTVGLLEAVTGRAEGTQDRTIEPTTNYAVVRARQDFRKGESGLGLLATAVNRMTDSWTDDFLRRDAYVAALDFRHRFPGGRYEVKGSVDLSRVSGSPAAIAATQRSAVHYFQRPDDDLALDPNRTSLWGDAQELLFGKVSGFIRFETSYQRRSSGFEVNDMGFLLRADQQSWNTWGSLNFQKPTKLYRMAFWNVNWWQFWTAEGLATERAANSNLHVQLQNRWWFHAGSTLGRLGGVYCDRCARGGPALRENVGTFSWGGINGDDRKPLVPSLWFNYHVQDGGRSKYLGVSPFFNVRASSRLSGSVGFNVSRNRDDAQWYGNFADAADVTHYTFARLEQRTTSVNLRADYTFLPNLTLQLYAQPFVSKGTYSNVRELNVPRAAAYDGRYQPYADPAVQANPGGFNVKQFRSNVVVRWEYLPGSTLFVVWTQGRQGFASDEGTRSMSGNLGDLFRLPAGNTFLLKASYWMNW